MELIWTRATGLVRRSWRATVVLALLAGLAAGVAMTMVAAGRRTATVFDRFARYADVPELLVNFCPPGVDPAEEGSVDTCLVYDPRAERDRIVALPEVEAASRGSFRGLTIAPVDDPEDRTLASSLAMHDPGIQSTAGRYRMVAGSDATDASEIVVNEHLARTADLSPGDQVVVTFWREDELGTFVPGATFHGPTATVSIAGISRALTDLTVSQVGFGADEAALAYMGPGLAEETSTAAGFTGVMVEATDDDAQAATAAIEDAFPNQGFNLVPALGEDETDPTRDAISYEAQATTSLGLVVAIVATAFVAQLLVRQSRREWSDGPVLRAIGVTRRDAVAAALLRSLAIGLPAVVIATITAVVLSPVGPVGVGRRAEVDRGVSVDTTVLALGSLMLLLAVTASVTAPLARGRVLHPARPVAPPTRARRSAGLPPVLTAGLHLARRGDRGAGVEVGTALVGIGAAVVVGIAAVGLAASFDDLTRTPERFGAPWDLSIGSSAIGDESLPGVLADDRRLSSVSQAAAIAGTDMVIGDETAWVHAFTPLDAVPDPAWAEAFAPLDAVPSVMPLPITDGRPPATAREIAVGGVTLRALGLSIGDTVTVTSATGGDTFEMDIVGVAVINDTFEASPGRGAVVSPAFIAEAASEIAGDVDPVVLRLDEGQDPQAFAADLRAVFDGPVQGPIQQAGVRNVGRIRGLPFLMAAVIAVLAAASLLHALVLSVSRNRRALGVLKGIGFTRSQVGATIACHATALALVALVAAVPLGIVAGRWGWQLVADQIGVPAVAIVPVLPPVAIAIAALVLANVVAAYPAWRAARLPTGAALRSE